MSFSPARHRHRQLSLLAVLLLVTACDQNNRTPGGPSPADGIRNSAALFRLITQTDPLTEYALFPNVEEFTVGRLNGSEAHRSIVRVSMNALAFGALQSGRLPVATQFPDGSIILKAIRPEPDAPVSVYAVMYKDAGNTLAGDRWLWAEFFPDGSVEYSVSDRGTACTSCHQREQGQRNDLVRTFERQR
jgi:Cytochrome P460